MRLSFLSLLLLTAANSAIAAQPETAEPSEQLQEREGREARFEPTPRAERQLREGSEAPRPRLPERVERAERTERVGPRASTADPMRDVARAAVEPGREERSRRPVTAPDGEPRPVDGAASWGWRERSGERRGRNRDLPPTAASPVFGSAIQTPETVTRPSSEVSAISAVPGTQPNAPDLRDRIAREGVRRDRIESENWRREWRQDRRYDWRRYRDRDRSRFNLGIYIDPFGWGYRDWDLGWRLPSRYYSSRYWIYDPWYYRLPPVGGPYRWIRYHDDVLLVDLRSGRVLDRLRRFFW